MKRGCLLRICGLALTVMVLCGYGSTAARAGGTPEEAVLLIDPTRPDSMYVGNYYLHARDIPRANALYMKPAAANYPTFVAHNLPALFGELANRSIRDHIDYIIIAPTDSFYVSAPGLVNCACTAPVTRFALTTGYTLWFNTAFILGGNMNCVRPNRYFGLNNEPWGFDSNIAWKNGVPSSDSDAHQYFISAYLGYTGERGNSLAEILGMIDRAVAADGTRPAGTFYYMETDDVRSEVRDPYFPTAVADIAALGGAAQHLYAVLPNGRHDCVGVMTGWATPEIEGTDMTLLPGAICDHLTSWAATFDIGSQTKMSRWIAKGACGTWGTVEEPCAMAGKFPHPRVDIYYYQGLSMGEAYLRSAAWLPFQGLLYGDPLTRPFAFLPVVTVPDAPTQPVSGTIFLTPGAATQHPTAQIELYRLLIDGVTYGVIPAGGRFAVNTANLCDGWHDLRILAYDNTLQRFTGRWTGALVCDNRGRSVTLDFPITTGNLATTFPFSINTTGAGVLEERLIQNGRVVATDENSPIGPVVHGLTLGAGPSLVQAEALFENGEYVRSAPIALQIAYDDGIPSGDPPRSYAYTKFVLPDEPFVVELPATCDDRNSPVTYQLLTQPAQATVLAGTGPYRIMQPISGAAGEDQFTFAASSAAGQSQIAAVQIVYSACIGDLNGDRVVDLSDLAELLGNYGTTSGATYEQGDLDGDGDVDLSDLAELLGRYGGFCYRP